MLVFLVLLRGVGPFDRGRVLFDGGRFEGLLLDRSQAVQTELFGRLHLIRESHVVSLEDVSRIGASSVTVRGERPVHLYGSDVFVHLSILAHNAQGSPAVLLIESRRLLLGRLDFNLLSSLLVIALFLSQVGKRKTLVLLGLLNNLVVYGEWVNWSLGTRRTHLPFAPSAVLVLWTLPQLATE